MEDGGEDSERLQFKVSRFCPQGLLLERNKVQSQVIMRVFYVCEAPYVPV